MGWSGDCFVATAPHSDRPDVQTPGRQHPRERHYLLKLLWSKLNDVTARSFDRLRTSLPYLPRAFGLVWATARRWTVAWAVLLLVQGLLPVATVYLTRAVVDSLVASLDGGADWANLRPTLLLVALMAGVLLLTEVLRSLTGWVRTAQSELVRDHISGLIHGKAVALDLAFYETPEYYDQLHRARVDGIGRPVALLENVGGLVQNSITLLAMAAVLVSFGPWVPALLLIGTLPAFYVVFRNTRRFHRWRMENTAAIRRTYYYDWMLTLREAAAELRLFALGDHFQTAFQQLRRRLRSERVALGRDQALAELLAGAMGLLAMGAALAWMVWHAVQGLGTLGDVALFYQAFAQGQRLMRSLLGNVGEVYRNVMFLENLFEFLALEPQVTDPPRPIPAPVPLRDGIRFEGVSFRYPGSQRAALDDFTLQIPAGEIVALVGANGAGKSTVIKLLCRFYDPQSGHITVDGVDLRDLSLDELRRQITILFQEPVRYHTTAAENIELGDLAATPSRPEIEAAAHAAAADVPISRLPEGYETVLGKWFGGAELSVGEWQRVALARAFLRRASIIVLDEPTSMMDSWAEADWLARFRALAAGRTAVIVTHRFTTAMQADVIHVMEAGRIVECGRHDELVALGGRYAQSWTMQMREAGSGATLISVPTSPLLRKVHGTAGDH